MTLQKKRKVYSRILDLKINYFGESPKHSSSLFVCLG